MNGWAINILMGMIISAAIAAYLRMSQMCLVRDCSSSGFMGESGVVGESFGRRSIGVVILSLAYYRKSALDTMGKTDVKHFSLATLMAGD